MKKYTDLLRGYSLALQISAIFLCSIFGALFAGIWIDQKLHTTPCLMLLLMVLGIAFAMYTIYRTINE